MLAQNRHLVELAIAFARAEPETVNLYLDNEEDEYRTRGYLPGKKYMHEILIEYKPRWAIARAWAGGVKQRDHLKEEVERLRTLVGRAAYELRRAGVEDEAERLERGLYGR